MRKHLRTVTKCAGVPLLLLTSATVFAKEFSLTGGAEYMSWREYSPTTGARLLQETGLRNYVSVESEFPYASNNAFTLMGRLYFGDVNYDGQLMDGTPWKAITRYTGLQGEAGVRYPLADREGDSSTAFILRGGVDTWERYLLGSAGYTERYQLVYARLGLQDDAVAGNWNAKGGLFLPLYTQEDVNLYDGVQLKPKGRPSFYFGLGRRLNKRLTLSFDYQAYRFDKSDLSAQVTQNGVPLYDQHGYPIKYLQPKSELDMYRFSVKYNF